MLRFDLPRVYSNVIRWEAFLVTVVCLIALSFNAPWLLAILALQGLVKGFWGHHRCPSHGLWKSLWLRLQRAGKPEDAGAKMFAAKILFIASSVALTLAALGSPMWRVPTTMLVIFSFLEWALSFCAACWVYGRWYQWFPPKY